MQESFMSEQACTSNVARSSGRQNPASGRSFLNERSRRTAMGVGVRALAVVVGLALSGSVNAVPLRTNTSLTGTWTSGPTRILLATATDQGLWAWEEPTSGSGHWSYLGVFAAISDETVRAVPVVVQTAAGNWETHVFFPQQTDSGTKVGHLVRHDSLGQSWSVLNDLPPLPGEVKAVQVAAVSNVYRRGDYISRPTQTVAEVGLYVLGSDGGLYDAYYLEPFWSNGWTYFGGSFGAVSGMTATYDFVGGFSTSVWITASSSPYAAGGLWESHGGVSASPSGRPWVHFSTGSHPNVSLGQVPAAVTWYDMNQPFTTSYEHTRVNVYDTSGNVMAFYRDHGAGGAWDYLQGVQKSGSMAAGPYIPNFLNAPAQSAVVAFDGSGSNRLMVLGKDDTNVVSGTDTWTMLPPVPDVSQPGTPAFTRIEFGGGTGYVYTVSNAGRLMEYIPSTNQWANRGYPGEKYYDQEYVNASADSRGYTGDGDWAVGELKAECGPTYQAVGISHSATAGYSLLCGSTDTPTSHTASQYTMSLDQGQGIGYHQLGAWDPDVFAQISECGTSDVVTGISQRNTSTVWPPATASMDYILCAPAGSLASNCRPLLFPASNNIEDPYDTPTWGNGNVKGECGDGSAIAGVSRDYNTGVVRGILCCDFGTM
jgi:hypothetical protein